MKKILLFILMSLSLCSSSYAMMLSQLPSGVFTGAGFGVHMTTPTETNQIPSGGGPNHVFTPNGSEEQQYAYQLMLEAGYQWSRPSAWFPAASLALEYIYVGGANMTGIVNQFGGGATFNAYQYKLTQHLILVNLKLDVAHGSPLIPFINADLGVAINKTSQYSSRPLSGSSLTFAFGNSSDTEFAYGGGAGVDYYLKKNIELELAYRYLCSGDARTGVSNNQAVTGTSILKNRLSSNSVYLLGHIFF